MNRQSRGLLLYFIVAVILVGSFMYLSGRMQQSEEYTNKEYEAALDGGQISSVGIVQNKQIPTGQLDVVLKDGSRKQLNVSNVNEIQEELKEKNIEYHVYDVPKDNTFLTTILPILVSVGLVLVLMMFMTRSMNGGGGSNAKMMNFGKSRARIVHRE